MVKKIIGICLYILLAAFFVTVVAFNFDTEFEVGLIKIILLIFGTISLSIYILLKKYHDLNNAHEGLFYSLFIILGLIFIFNDVQSDAVCRFMGISDIICGSLGLGLSIPLLFRHKMTFLEMVIFAGDITFGIILCIKTAEGMTGHLIFLSISMILLALMQIIEISHEKRE